MILKSLHNTAELGSWIKDEFRGDRSLGFVLNIDKETNMMLVRFPKISKDTWIAWQNKGHYVVI